ncbi:MAG: hypothetical protein IK130_10590 [Oscillospiraceae bacterium]|nr:hypothetical protein [Oscillospiraceae bacterium]
MKKASTYLFSVILTILLILSMLGTIGLMLMKFRALNAGTCLQLVQSQDLAERVHQSLEKYYQEQENVTGIPLSVYADSISTGECDKLIRLSITNAFGYMNGTVDEFGIKPDFSELKADMTAFFEDYAEKNDFEKDETYQKKLDEAQLAAQTNIKTECDVFRFATLQEAGLIDKVKKVVPYVGFGLIGCAAADLLLFLLLLAVNRKEKQHVWYWLGNSLLVSAILIMIPAVWLNVTRWFDKFAVKTDQIFAAVTGYLYGLTHAAITAAGVAILLAVCSYILFIIQHRMRNARTNGR